MSCMCKMGVNVSKGSDDQLKRHKVIEQGLKEDRRRNETHFKLLLLGAGDSGKSTVVKQMKILHMNGFTEEEVNQQRIFVIQNIIQSICTILKAMDSLGIIFDDPEREKDAALVLKAEEEWLNRRSLGPEEWECVKLLWRDQGLQACFNRSDEYQLGDSTKYFCDDLDRISSQLYSPSYDDILHTRVSTLGIVELSFPFRGLTLTIIDVGGQRSQRKKWIHCFEGVNCLIYIASLSEYNQVLLEDASVNRMQEALKLFETVCNCQWFRKTPTILFLNKKDLFAQKLKLFPLTLGFPAYQGRQVYEEAVNYVEKQFEKRKHIPTKQIYTHKTCATDTKNIEFVMAASFDIVLSKNMKEAGFT